MGIMQRSREHLAGVEESYVRHLRFAGAVGSLMILAGGACLIHALIPALFEDRASRTIRRLYAVIENRAAPEAAFASDGEADGLLTLLALAMLAALMPWLLGAETLVAAPVSLLSLAFPVAAFCAATGAEEARNECEFSRSG